MGAHLRWVPGASLAALHLDLLEQPEQKEFSSAALRCDAIRDPPDNINRRVKTDAVHL